MTSRRSCACSPRSPPGSSIGQRAQEAAKLADILQEKRPPNFSNYDARKVDAALALIGFDQEKDKAIAVLKEELGKTKVPPVELFLDRIPALEDKLRGIVPELMAMAPRLTYEHQLFYRMLKRIDPQGVKAMQPELGANSEVAEPARTFLRRACCCASTRSIPKRGRPTKRP